MRSLFEAPAISVGELCRRIKGMVDGAFAQRVRVTGEMSGCQVATSGHVYFTLRDREGLIKCVCYHERASRIALTFPLPDGSEVEVDGRVNWYGPRGQIQILVNDVTGVGRGELYRRFEMLKEKLRREGLFEQARKRPVPPFVRRVAIVTSRGAAALQDFLTTCRRRGAHVAVTVVHAPVQGAASADRLARAIVAAGRRNVDVVVVARGGGSIEDLWCFNTEAVARAIAQCERPVISALGHETDVTIADFVADRRAATPTAAAEMVSPDREKLLAQIRGLERRLARALSRSIGSVRGRFARSLSALRRSPVELIGSRVQLLDEIDAGLRAGDPRRRAAEYRRRIAHAFRGLVGSSARMLASAEERLRGVSSERRSAMARGLALRRATFDLASARLRALGPTNTLRRGYAIVFGPGGHVLVASDAAKAGDALDIELYRGRLKASVTATEARNGEDDDQEKG